MKKTDLSTDIGSAMLLLVVGFSWILLFLLFRFEAVMLFAPWDTAITRPDPGTWQRMLNDVFETGGGSSLLALTLVGLSVWRVARCVHRTSGRLFQILLTNMIIFFSMPLAITAAFRFVYVFLFPYPDVPYDPAYRGYHLTVLPMIVAIFMLVVWYRAQSRILSDTSKSKRKRHQQRVDGQQLEAIHRLSIASQSGKQSAELQSIAEKQRRLIT